MKQYIGITFAFAPWVGVVIALLWWAIGGFEQRRSDNVASTFATISAGIPTATPEPVVTIEPTKIPIQKYKDESIDVIASTRRVRDILLRNLDVIRLDTREWDDTIIISAIQDQVGFIREFHTQAKNIHDIPQEAQQTHTVLLDALDDCNTATNQIMRGITNHDIAQFDQATTLFDACNSKMIKAVSLFPKDT